MTEIEKRLKVVATVAAKIGVKESPANSNKVEFCDWYDLKPQKYVSWCAIFMSWGFVTAGFPLGKVHEKYGTEKGFHDCASALNFFKKKNMVISQEKAQLGDMVIFDWNGDGKPDHVGLFERHNGDGSFMCIEGNTAVGNDSNGGEVMRRKRKQSGNMKFYFICPDVYTKESV
jgi:hypothetical protein